MNKNITRFVAKLASVAATLAFAAHAQAGVVFTFTQSGDQVVMQSSGSLDTSKLVSTGVGLWGGRGIEDNRAPNTDIMGDTRSGGVNAGFRFNTGTDQSAWLGGLFTLSNFNWYGTGTTQFSTYVMDPTGVRAAGLSIGREDLMGTIWTPNVSWTSNGAAALSGLGLTAGSYSVVDALTQEFITIQVGAAANATPEPTALGLARRAKRA